MVVNQDKIKKQLIDKNYTKGIIINPKYIVVHDTDNRDFGSTAKFNRDYLAINSRVKTSAHYIIDDKNIIQLLEDRWRAWHIGDSSNSKITNSNSIGIKICVNRGSNLEKTMDNMLYIIKYLMNKYNIPKENIVRHFDVSGKICPRIMIEDNPSMWTSLMEAIENNYDKVIVYRSIAKGYLNDVLTKLNIKSQKDRKSENIGVLNQGEEIIIYELSDSWAKIITKDRIPRFGYVNLKFIEVQKNQKSNTKVIIKKEKLPIKEIIEIKEEVAANIINEIDKTEVLSKGLYTSKDISANKIKINKDGIVSKKVMNLEVRKGPDKSFYVMSYLLPGEKVRVIEKQGYWYNIMYSSNRGDRFGYVECEFIEI